MSTNKSTAARIGKWVLALSLGAVVPAIAFDICVRSRWDFEVTPSWSWATIAVVPLGSSLLLFLRGPRLAKIVRPALAVLILHAVGLASLLTSKPWQAAAEVSLFLDLTLIAAILPATLRSGVPGRLSRATILWVGLFFGVTWLVGLANGAMVAWRAEEIAGERPYCIQYASQTDPFAYEPVRTLFDLSALKMQTRLMSGGSTMFILQHHALLIVEDTDLEFFNWSYARENFVDEVPNRKFFKDPARRYLAPETFCAPKGHYALHLPVWSHVPGKMEFLIAGRRLVIPDAYRPRLIGTGHRLLVDASSPEFTAYNPHTDRLTQHWYDVVIGEENQADLARNLKGQIGKFTENVGSSFDLDKTQLYNDNTKRFPTAEIYTGYEADGRLTVFIHCSAPTIMFRPPRRCRYTFTNDGLQFSLYIDDPSQWEAAKKTLTGLFASFELSQQP